MDINQLIADMQEISQKNSISLYKRDRCASAATALATLQAENELLREKVEDARLEGYAKGIGEMCAELEQVKQERDELERFLGELEGAVYSGQYFHLRPMIEKWHGQKED